MGTVYRTICECQASAPEPSQCEFETGGEFEAAWQDWNQSWTATADAHHPYCCEQAREGRLTACCDGDDEHCPHLAR